MSLGRDTATLLDLCTLVTADIASVGHNNDLFEEGDRSDAHLDHARIETAWAR